MNDNGSLYDFVSEDYQAPTVANNAAVDTPHQNRANLSSKYVQSNSTASKVKAAPVHQQKDLSSTSWWRMFTQQSPVDTFEQSVWVSFGGKPAGNFDYDIYRSKFITMYKNMLDDLPS